MLNVRVEVWVTMFYSVCLCVHKIVSGQDWLNTSALVKVRALMPISTNSDVPGKFFFSPRISSEKKFTILLSKLINATRCKYKTQHIWHFHVSANIFLNISSRELQITAFSLSEFDDQTYSGECTGIYWVNQVFGCVWHPKGDIRFCLSF